MLYKVNEKNQLGTLIGHVNLDLEDFVNEDCINSGKKDDMLDLKKVGKCDIYVYSGEGPNEHFHIIGSGFEACVRIYSAVFFPHEDNHKLLSKKRIVKS